MGSTSQQTGRFFWDKAVPAITGVSSHEEKHFPAGSCVLKYSGGAQPAGAEQITAPQLAPRVASWLFFRCCGDEKLCCRRLKGELLLCEQSSKVSLSDRTRFCQEGRSSSQGAPLHKSKICTGTHASELLHC